MLSWLWVNNVDLKGVGGACMNTALVRLGLIMYATKYAVRALIWSVLDYL